MQQFRIRRFSINRNWTFSIIYFFAWAAYATFPLDYVFFSQHIGLNNIEIGILYSTLGLLGIVAQPIFIYIQTILKAPARL